MITQVVWAEKHDFFEEPGNQLSKAYLVTKRKQERRGRCVERVAGSDGSDWV